MTFELTAEQVTGYLSASGGLEAGADLNALKAQLMQMCIEVGLADCATKPIWGIVPSEGIAESVLEPDQPFSFSVEIDVHPDIDWPDWSALEITRPTRTISEDMIEAELMEQRRGVGTSEARNGDFETGDVIQVEASIRGAETDAVLMTFTSDLRVPAKSGSIAVSNMIFEGLHEAVKGRGVGDEVELLGTMPQGSLDLPTAGNKIRATFLIKAGTRPVPATVEEVLAHYGTPNEIILREQIKHALNATAKRDQTEIVIQQVVAKLLDLVGEQIYTPDRVLKFYAQNARQMMQRSLEARGLSESEAEIESANHQDAIAKGALVQARQQALITLLAQRLEVKANEQDFMSWTADLAARQGRRPEEVRKEFNAPEQLQQIAIQILREKVVKRILGDATVTDVDAELWNAQNAKGS